ncbi:MAG: hypothetical protein U1E73_13560 [Planctomycetota bacterium]
MRSRLLRVVLAASLLVGLASAQFAVVVPNGWANTVEDSANALPFASTSTSFPGVRVQHIYDSSEFTNQGVASPILITGLRWRAQDLAAIVTWTGGTWSSVTIRLSTAAVDHLGATTTFAANHGADLTVAYVGSVAMQAGVGNGVGVLGAWYIDVQLQAPFLYDPSAGDLVVDVDNPAPATNWSNVLDRRRRVVADGRADAGGAPRGRDHALPGRQQRRPDHPRPGDSVFVGRGSLRGVLRVVDRGPGRHDRDLH